MILKSDIYKPYYLKTFERHQRDLEDVKNGKKAHLRFNKTLGIAYVKVLETFKHYKGKWAGKYLKLEDWQKKSIAIWAGWEKLNSDGEWVRRFDESFWFMPKKNGKTILASGLAIVDALIRGETGGEVYSFATKYDQAKLAWFGMDKLLKEHEELRNYRKLAYSTVSFTKNDTIFKAIGRDSQGLDGISATFGVADERHEHPDNSIRDVVKSSMAARKQPHLMDITTAGFNVAAPAYEDYKYAKKVVEGVIDDDSLFVFIAEAPPKPEGEEFDDWYFREEVWKAANPNYGISVNRDFLKSEIKKIKERPEKLNPFLTKHLNVWTGAKEGYFNLDDWNKCKGDVKRVGDLVGGLDLNLNDDFAAFVEVWRYKGVYTIIPHFYLPKEGIEARERELKAPLVSWVQQGFLTLTPGKTTNYMYIYNDIYPLLGDMLALGYDAYKAKKLIKLIEEPLDMDLILEFGEDIDYKNIDDHNKTYNSCIPITQGFRTLNEPTVFFKNLIKERKIRHDGNPIMTWMITNAVAEQNAQGNVMLSKKDAKNKIDGVAATINALAVLLAVKEEKNSSVYEERGLRDL